MKALALLLALSSGCSFVAVRRAPKHPDPHQPVECTTYRGAPLLDAALAIASTIAFAVTTHDCGPDGCHVADFSGLYLIPAVGFGISSLAGFSWTSDCRQAIGARQQRVKESATLSQ